MNLNFLSPKSLFAVIFLSLGIQPFSANAQTIPTLNEIPPHTSISALTHYQFVITSQPNTYSVSSPTLLINFTIIGSSTWQQPPYVNELIELSSNTGPVISVSPQTDCTRNNNVLSCTKLYTLPASDLSEPARQIKVRYYADRFIPNSTYHWIGYSEDEALITLFNSGSSTPTTQVCTVENNPLMPNQTGFGTFTFTIPANDVCPSEFWIDPPIAGGYNYTVSGANFLSVTMPSLQTVNDSSGYLIEYPGVNFGPGVRLNAGQQHTFTYPVAGFSIKGINPSLALDPNDAAAFATGIKLSTPTGPVTITQSAIVQNNPGLGTQPTGCNAWTQHAFLHGIKAQLPSFPSTTYNLRVRVDPTVQQALLADLASVRAWRQDTREINLKVHATDAGNGVDPQIALPSNPTNPGVDTMTSIFRSQTQFMAVDTWTGNKFQTDHWYRVDSKVNVMDYDNEWISPWMDNCLYQTAFVKVSPTGNIDLRVYDDLSGVNGSPL
jgi:hypothetical protein